MLTSRPHQPRVQMLTCLFWEHMQHSLGREVPILPRPLTIPPCITPLRPLSVACGCVGVAAKPSVAYCLGVRLLSALRRTRTGDSDRLWFRQATALWVHWVKMAQLPLPAARGDSAAAGDSTLQTLARLSPSCMRLSNSMKQI